MLATGSRQRDPGRPGASPGKGCDDSAAEVS